LVLVDLVSAKLLPGRPLAPAFLLPLFFAASSSANSGFPQISLAPLNCKRQANAPDTQDSGIYPE
jgi:hypothetical protein